VCVPDRLFQIAEHLVRIVALDDDGCPALPREILCDILVGGPAEDRRPRDLRTVEVQDREHRAVATRVQEGRKLPRRRQRPGLRLTVSDDAGDREVRAVEGGTRGVHECVAQFAGLVDAAGCGHADMARNAAGRGELAAQHSQSLGVAGDLRIDLAVRALQIRRRDQCGTAVAGTGDVEPVGVGAADVPVENRVDHRQAGARAPVPEKPGLDVLGP
jgi:hypothetical protein